MIGTANIRNFPDMNPAAVAADVATVMRHCTVAGLQEIQPHEDTPVVRDRLGKDWDMVGGARETPVIWDARRWRLLDHRTIPFSRPPSLPRPQNQWGAVTSAILRSVERRHLPAFAVVNAHLVSGGHNGPQLPVLADRWRVEWGMFQSEVTRLWRSGLTVFAVGDLNDPRPPELRPHDRFAWVSPTGGPDHVGQLLHHDSVQLEAPVHQAVPLNSDHGLHVVTGPLRHADES